MEILLKILQDAFFAALAAIGFASISNLPRVAYKYCALIAASGHALRFCMVTFLGLHLVWASFIGAFAIGFMAIWFAPKVKCPPEAFSFPSLLPMVPGVYAYKSFQAFLMMLAQTGEEEFLHYSYLLEFNGITCLLVIFAMVVGQLLPLFILRHKTYTATRG